MSLPPFRGIFRRQFESVLRQRAFQRRAQSSSSSSSSSSPSSPSPRTSSNTSQAADPVQQKTPSNTTSGPVPFFQRLGPITTAANAYARSQRKRPYATQVASALFIFFCADISAQSIGGHEYDPKRTGRSLIIGAVAAIPQFKWFIFLSKSFNYSSRILTLGIKVLMNQFVFATVFNSYFFAAQAFLAGEGIAATVERVRTALPPSWLNSWKLWPTVTLINFSYVPIEYRSVFAGFVAIGWQTYLTWLNRKAEEAKLARANALQVEHVMPAKEDNASTEAVATVTVLSD